MAATKRLNYFSVLLYFLSGWRADGGANSPAGFLKLTSTGRKSGLLRMSRLIYIRDDADYVLTASNGGGPRDPGWLFNVRANPQVMLDVHGARINGVAEIAEPEKRHELWARLVAIAPMFQGYEKSTRREIQMVIVHPEAASAAGGAA
jgi:deazaflavin-dependent oxidoreductase (nitroreductase family)